MDIGIGIPNSVHGATGPQLLEWAKKAAVSAYEHAGVDELILDPSMPDPAQVDLLAEVTFG